MVKLKYVNVVMGGVNNGKGNIYIFTKLNKNTSYKIAVRPYKMYGGVVAYSTKNTYGTIKTLKKATKNSLKSFDKTSMWHGWNNYENGNKVEGSDTWQDDRYVYDENGKFLGEIW